MADHMTFISSSDASRPATGPETLAEVFGVAVKTISWAHDDGSGPVTGSAPISPTNFLNRGASTVILPDGGFAPAVAVKTISWPSYP
jgi:hypothetical protein